MSTDRRVPRPGILALWLFLAAMMLRPTLLGDSFSFAGSFLALCCGIYVFSKIGFDGRQLQMLVTSQGSAVTLWLFLMCHSILNNVQNWYAISAFIQISTCSIGVTLCFSDDRTHDIFFEIFRKYFAICGASFILTVAMSAIVGMGVLRVASITTLHYDGLSEWYFPLTLAYGYKEQFGVAVPRLGAGFREAGIAQAFIACAILSVPELRTSRQWAMFALLMVGGLGTQSTTGIAIVGIASGIRVMRIGGINPFIRAGIILASAYLATIAVDAAINDETIGLASKLETDSFLDRSQQVEAGLQEFYDNPFGDGLYSDKSGGGINIISSLGGVGIFGAVMIIINIIAVMMGSRNKIQKVIFVFPLFVTAMTSQPLLDAALVYLFYGYVGSPERVDLRKGVPGRAQRHSRRTSCIRESARPASMSLPGG